MEEEIKKVKRTTNLNLKSERERRRWRPQARDVNARRESGTLRVGRECVKGFSKP